MMKNFVIAISLLLLSASNLMATEIVTEQNLPKSGSLLITKVNDYYTMGDKTMSKEQYLNFIKENCSIAWDSYQKGNRLWKTGWGLLGSGIGTFVIGTTVYCVGAYDYLYTQNKTVTPYNNDMIVGGAIVMAAGSLLMAGSIPCLIVGGIKRNNSHEVYNEIIGQRSIAVTFGIQPTSNGLAMVMQF